MEHVVDLIPGYALGSLDEDELIRVARHLPGCASCRAELDSYLQTVDQLAFLVTERVPPAALKEKILNRVGAPAEPPRSQPVHVPAKRTGGLFYGLFSQPFAGIAAVAALLLLIILGASTLALWQQVNGLQDAVDRQGKMNIVYLDGTENAPATHGYLMVFSNENYGTLIVEDAPALPAGYQYQLWLIRDGKRTSGGVFSVDEHGYGVLQIESEQPLESFPSFGVTVEPAGGSPGPTGDRVLGGSL